MRLHEKACTRQTCGAGASSACGRFSRRPVDTAAGYPRQDPGLTDDCWLPIHHVLGTQAKGSHTCPLSRNLPDWCPPLAVQIASADGLTVYLCPFYVTPPRLLDVVTAASTERVPPSARDRSVGAIELAVGELARGRVDDLIVIGAALFHEGDLRELADNDIRVGGAFVAKPVHVLDEVVLVPNAKG